MSTTVVDERIVTMEFDNRHFEKNVSTTMNTLDKLKQSLRFKGATNGLEEINNASNNLQSTFDQTEITSTRAGFSLRDVWLKTASIFEYQIAGRIISSAKNMISALTIDPIKTGLSEYETQLNSVQTILANTESKGSTLEDVNAALDELNTYADKTIYNFTEMTRNIGTFTAAGVDLDTSVSAIQGIANLAAVSGSTSQQASTAMYQLSQALSSGTVRLMDWNSVVNAGMGGEVFQNALKETAKVHGVAIDDIIKKNGSFRESLKDEWLTAEILTDTLKQFTMAAEEGSTEWNTYLESLKDKGYTEKQAKEILKMANTATDAATKVKTFSQLLDTLKESAQSGWAQTWEIIIGDFEAAKELWTGVSNVIGGVISDSADARNQLLSNALGSGWDKLMGEGIMDEAGYSEHLKKIAKERGIDIEQMIKDEGSLEKAVRKCLQEEKMSANDLSLALGKLSSEYENCSDEELKNLGYTREQIKALSELNRKVQNGTISMDEYAKSISQLSGREHIIESFKELYRFIKEILAPIKDAWDAIFPSDLDKNAKTLYSLVERFHNFTKRLKVSEKTANNLKQTFKGLFAVLDIGLTIGKAIIKIVTGILGKIFPLGDGVLSLTGSLGDALVKFRDFIKGGDKLNKFADGVVSVFGKLIECIKTFFKALKEKIKTPGLDGFVGVVKKVWSVVKNIFGKIGELISSVWTQMKENFTLDNVKKGFSILSTGLITGLVAKILIGIIKFIKGFKDLGFKEIVKSFKGLIDGITGPLEALQTKIKAQAIEVIAKAILILVGSLIILSFIDHEKLMDAITVIGILMGIIIATIAALGKISGGAASAATEGPTKFVDSLKNAFNGIGQAKGLIQTVSMLVKLSTAILILAVAMKIIATMEWDEIAKGLVAVGACLVALLGTLAILRLIGKIDTKSDKVTKGLIKLALTLLILAGVLKLFAKLSWDEIGRGLTAMSASLLILVGAISLLKIVNKVAKGNKSTGPLLRLIGVMTLLAGALKIFASMSWNEIWRGLTAMSLSLIALVGAISLLKIVNKVAKGNKSTGPLLRLIGVLTLLSGSLKVLGSMSWGEIWRSLTAMSLSLIALSGVVTVLKLISKIKGNADKQIFSLLKLVGVLALMSGTLKILGSMSWDEIARGISGMGLSLVVLITALNAMSKIKSTKQMATKGASQLAIMAGSLIMVGLALKVLSTMGWEQMGSALVAMTASLILMIGALAILSKINTASPTSMILTATSMAIMAGAIMLLAPALALLGNLNLATIGKGLLAIASVLIIFGTAAFLLQGLVPAMLGVAGALALLGVACLAAGVGVAMMAVGITSLAAIGPVAAAAIVKSMTIILTGLISLIPAMATALAEGVIEFCKVIATGAETIASALVAVLLSVLDLLTEKTPEITESLAKIIIGILNQLEKFIPDLTESLFNILAGVIQKLIDFIPTLSQMVVEIFIALFEGVINAFESIDKTSLFDALESVGLIAALVAAIAAITPLIPQAALGVVGLGGVVAELALVLTAIGALSNIPGLSNLISDGGNLLELLGTAIGQFVGGIVGGIGQGVSGSLPEIGSDLSNFMTNLTPFLDGLKSIDSSTVEAGGMLAGLLLTITATDILNALTSWATGESSLADFGTQIAAFGVGIKNFANNVKGVDAASVTAAAEAGKVLANMSKHIPTSGGLWNLIKGENSLKDFGNQLGDFGEGVKKFATSTSGIDANSVTVMANAAEYLCDIASDVDIPSKFEKSMKRLGDGISEFIDAVKDMSNVSGTIAQVNQLMASLEDLEINSVDSLVDSLDDASADVPELFEAMITDSISAVNKKAKSFRDALKGLVTDGIGAIKTKNNYDKFYSTGKYFVEGFAAGISENDYLATAKATAMANAAAEAAKAALDEHSPSKVGYKIGDFFGIAFVNAIGDYAVKAYDAAYNMASEAKTGLGNAISKVSNIIENGIDSQPTIRPVVDLTNVNDGVAAMKGMFGLNPTIGVAGSINASINKNQNRSSNDDVVSAIKDLSNKFEQSNSGGNTYNINGINTSDTDVQEAIETLVRAVTVGRRM